MQRIIHDFDQLLQITFIRNTDLCQQIKIYQIHYHECISKNRRKNDKLQMDYLCYAIFCNNS